MSQTYTGPELVCTGYMDAGKSCEEFGETVLKVSQRGIDVILESGIKLIGVMTNGFKDAPDFWPAYFVMEDPKQLEAIMEILTYVRILEVLAGVTDENTSLPHWWCCPRVYQRKLAK